jgi:hypothetical protein
LRPATPGAAATIAASSRARRGANTPPSRTARANRPASVSSKHARANATTRSIRVERGIASEPGGDQVGEGWGVAPNYTDLLLRDSLDSVGVDPLGGLSSLDRIASARGSFNAPPRDPAPNEVRALTSVLSETPASGGRATGPRRSGSTNSTRSGASTRSPSSSSSSRGR